MDNIYVWYYSGFFYIKLKICSEFLFEGISLDSNCTPSIYLTIVRNGLDDCGNKQRTTLINNWKLN